jgi:hypothetical protein
MVVVMSLMDYGEDGNVEWYGWYDWYGDELWLGYGMEVPMMMDVMEVRWVLWL